MATLVLIALALWGTLAGVVDRGGAPHSERVPNVATPQPESEGPAGATGSGAPGHLLVVGDSLAVGTEEPLAHLLPDWRIKTSAFTGRQTADGVAQIVGMTNLPGTIVVSLGTNDDPSGNREVRRPGVRGDGRGRAVEMRGLAEHRPTRRTRGSATRGTDTHSQQPLAEPAEPARDRLGPDQQVAAGAPRLRRGSCDGPGLRGAGAGDRFGTPELRRCECLREHIGGSHW